MARRLGPADRPPVKCLDGQCAMRGTVTNPDTLGRRAICEPERTTPNGPGPAKHAIPARRTCKSAFAWRYPTRTPNAQMISSPPTPGRATAANADNEAGTNNALTVCSRNDRNPRAGR